MPTPPEPGSRRIGPTRVGRANHLYFSSACSVSGLSFHSNLYCVGDTLLKSAPGFGRQIIIYNMDAQTDRWEGASLKPTRSLQTPNNVAIIWTEQHLNVVSHERTYCLVP